MIDAILHDLAEHWGRYAVVICTVLVIYLVWLNRAHRRNLEEIRRVALEIAAAERAELAREFTKESLSEEHERTRAHISAEMATLRGDTQTTKANSHSMLALMKRLAEMFGHRNQP
jgi:predicted solute-binding protein